MNEPSEQDKLATIKKWLGKGSINIFGMPFAGKDTQSKLLADMLGAELIGSGDVLRSYADQEKVKQLMSTGELFPTDFYLEIILPFLSKPEFANKPLILNAVGRWLGEEKVVMQAAETAGHPIKALLFINLDSAQVHSRFELSQQNNDRGQRHDDALHLIEIRLREFKQKTLPVVEAYRQAGLLLEVDGNQSTENVYTEIVNSLFNKAAS